MLIKDGQLPELDGTCKRNVGLKVKLDQHCRSRILIKLSGGFSRSDVMTSYCLFSLKTSTVVALLQQCCTIPVENMLGKNNLLFYKRILHCDSWENGSDKPILQLQMSMSKTTANTPYFCNA